MKQLIKSATIYCAELPSANMLREHFLEDAFCDVLSLQAGGVGFVPRTDTFVWENGVNLVEDFAGGMAFTVRVDAKIIPSSVVKAEVDRRAKLVERDTGSKPGKKERAEMKLEVIDSFLPHALVRSTLITCYHHTATNYLIIPTTSKKLAQQVVTLLVNSVGSVKTTTINVADAKGGLTRRLKQWVGGDLEAFGGLDPRTEVVLEQGERKVSVKMSDLASAGRALNEALDSHFTVKSLGLSFDNDVELRLTDDFKMRGIWNPCAVEEEDPEFDTFAAKAAIEVAELTGAITFLCEMLGYQEEAKA
jgi:recombination associated protein RdgC